MDPAASALPQTDAASAAGGGAGPDSAAPATANEASGGGNVEEGNQRRMDSSGVLQETDGAAFHDPYAVMASSAADLAPDEPIAVDVPQTTQGAPGHTAVTEDVRDPFDPAYWQTVQPRPARTVRPGPADAADRLPPDAHIDAGDRRPTEPPAAQTNAPADRSATTTAARPSEGAAQDEDADPLGSVGPRSSAAEAVLAALGEAPGRGRPGSSGKGDAPAPAAGPREAVEATAAALRQALTGAAAGVEVRVEERGGKKSLLISLTDERAFSMFPIGSAAPTGDARALFERVAGVLAERNGHVVVRGHTDARPFRGEDSDNWMLSFARAHATKEALVSSGVSEKRIVRVEGLADREPSRPDDPLADENRRIEILYEPQEEAR